MVFARLFGCKIVLVLSLPSRTLLNILLPRYFGDFFSNRTITIQKRTNSVRTDSLLIRQFALYGVQQDFLCTCRFLDTGVPGWHYSDWRHWQIDHPGVLTKLFCVKFTNQLLRNITTETSCFTFINMCSPCCSRHLANGNQVSEHDLPL